MASPKLSPDTLLPFLSYSPRINQVIHFEPGKRAIGIKCITNNEPQFTGHFPDRPIMPGVLQVSKERICTSGSNVVQENG